MNDNKPSYNRRWWPVLLRCYRYLRPYWRVVVGIYVALLLINGLSLLVPLLIQRSIDEGIRGQDLSRLGWSAALLLLLALVRGFLVFLQGRWLEVASQAVAYDLRNDIQHKLTSLPFSYHDRAETGQLLSRAIQDVDRIRFLTGRATWRVLDGVVAAIATTVVLMSLEPTLALLVFLVIPLLVWQGIAYGRQYRPLSLELQEQLGVLTAQLEQNLRAMRVIKAFAREEAEIAAFQAENERYFDMARTGARLEAVYNPLLELIVNAGAVMILLYGGLQVINGRITLGVLVAFTTYLAQLASPVRTLGRVIPALAQAAAAGERIFAILDTVPAVRDAPDAVPLTGVRGEVRFENVSFAYTPRYNALHDVSFEARPGEVVALLGATGSGKSTLINLIPRFYDATRGRVLIDGHDVRSLEIASLRSHIGIVLQESTLFAATIRENIAFGRENATEEEIIEAAKAAQAHDFILSTPEGYDTRVGERGVTLSGGQKQRLAIARALLIDPRILILDDATASVDTETERLIQVALDRLMEGRTTFVIAHRLSTVRRADLILVLEQGRVVERGTHEELIKRSGLYQEVYTRQLRPDAGRWPDARSKGERHGPRPRLA